MTIAAELMHRSLASIGEAGVDVIPPIFERFFVHFPEHRRLFITLEAAAGRMVQETLDALIGLAEGAWWAETTVVNFVDLHRNYGAFSRVDYAGWLECVLDVLAEAAGSDWSRETDRAWRHAADHLLALLDNQEANAAAS